MLNAEMNIVIEYKKALIQSEQLYYSHALENLNSCICTSDCRLSSVE